VKDSVTARFRAAYEKAHTGHRACVDDEWLTRPCAGPDGAPLRRPVIWSRRNGPWTRVEILWVGAAPGNAGGRGEGELGAHGTRIPFGGDVAGANLEVLFGSIGLTRNETFITAALNQLPARGGGEPTPAEIAAPVGAYPSSLHLLRDTLIATGPKLLVALGNVALRTTVAAALLDAGDRAPVRLPGLPRLSRAGLHRGQAVAWPAAEPPAAAFLERWRGAWGDVAPPALLWLTHPSAQNMSPFAGIETAFHTRMLDARRALVAAARRVLGRPAPHRRPAIPTDGIYALPEWRDLIAPRLRVLDELWRTRGV
jgi:uracil-DNA glycosylase